MTTLRLLWFKITDLKDKYFVVVPTRTSIVSRGLIELESVKCTFLLNLPLQVIAANCFSDALVSGFFLYMILILVSFIVK